MEREVDAKGLQESFHVAEFITFGDFLDVHHVIKAEECVDIDAGLQVSRHLQRLLNELDRICLEKDLATVFLLVDGRDHL